MIAPRTAALRKLGISDAIVRGTGLSANLLMISIISLYPGFGLHGLLLSSLIQMLITGLLEIPTGVLADRFGWVKSVKLGLALKILTTLLFIAALIACSYQNMTLAWILIALEAGVDAFANAFVNGAYQSSYLQWFKQRLSSSSAEPKEIEVGHPFLESFKYGFWIRIAMPIFLLTVGFFINQSYGVSALTPPLCLLLLLLGFRVIALMVVSRDLGSQSTTGDQNNAGNAKATKGTRLDWIDAVVLPLAHEPVALGIYGVCSFFIVAVGSFLIGQIYRTLNFVGIEENKWVVGLAIALLVQVISIVASRYYFPKLAAVTTPEKILKPFLLSIVASSTLALIVGAVPAMHTFIPLAVFLLCATTLVSAQGIQRWIVSASGEKISHKIRATWFSSGEVCGLMLYAGLSGITYFSGAGQYAGIIVCAAIAVVSVTSFLILFRSKFEIFKISTVTISLKKYLSVGLVLLVVFFSVRIAIWDASENFKKNQKIAEQTERTMVLILDTVLREPVLQGSYVEARARISKIEENQVGTCIELTANKEPLASCATWLSKSSTVKSYPRAIYFDENKKFQAAEYVVHFNREALVQAGYLSFFYRLLFVTGLGLILYFSVVAVAKRIFSELQTLLSTTSDPAGVGEQMFVIDEFSKISTKLQENISLQKKIAHIEATHLIARQVAHDIRSPLSVLQIINKKMGPMPEPYGEMFNQSIQRVRGIANKILKESSGISGVGLNHDGSAASIASILKNTSTEKGLEFERYPNVSIVVKCATEIEHLKTAINADDLKAILSNLINNSYEAIESKKGTITLVATKQDHELLVSVTDTGKGLAPELLDKVGDLGVSFKSGFSDSGSGIGLYSAKKLLHSYNASLNIESELGEGTTVTLKIPLLAEC